MTAQVLTLTVAACLVALGLGTAIARRHRLAPVIGAQLGGLGAVLAILTLVGVAGEWFAALVVVLTTLMGVLVAALAVYLRFIHPMVGFEPYIPPMGYRPLLYLVMLLETLGFLLVGSCLVSEQIAQVRDELDSLRRKGR